MVKNCQLGSVLSYGSEGIVYSGTWRGTLAAIKVLSNQYARRVENEVKLVTSFDHTNIIKYYDLEYEQGTAYLAMEFITGGNFYEFIQQKFTSSSYWTTVDQILRDVARGMVYLHDHRIVQGDLKSHNILLHEGTHQAVICDFGISRSLDNDNQEKKRVNTTKGKSIASYCLVVFLEFNPYFRNYSMDGTRTMHATTRAIIVSIRCLELRLYYIGNYQWS
jgi:serine/threonine protein kinase